MQPFSIDYITGNVDTRTFPGYGAPMALRMTAPDIVDHNDSIFSTPNFDDVYHVMNHDVSLSQITPTLSYVTDIDVKSSHERQLSTPSPTKDSGIESDGSPAVQSTDAVSMTLRDLEKKASETVTPLTSDVANSTQKPPHSYIALIARAILSAPDRKLTLCDIYRHIMNNHGYYNNEDKAWRNSIRYNLSVNECFMKKGKEETGKGHYWAIHPTCVENFENGDYRRRHARRRARRNVKTLNTADVITVAQPRFPVYTPMTPTSLAFQPHGLSGYTTAHNQPQPAYASQMSRTVAQRANDGHMASQFLPGVQQMYNSSHNQPLILPRPTQIPSTSMKPYGKHPAFYPAPSMYTVHQQGQQLYHHMQQQQQQQHKLQHHQPTATSIEARNKTNVISADVILTAWSAAERAADQEEQDNPVVVIT